MSTSTPTVQASSWNRGSPGQTEAGGGAARGLPGGGASSHTKVPCGHQGQRSPLSVVMWPPRALLPLECLLSPALRDRDCCGCAYIAQIP